MTAGTSAAGAGVLTGAAAMTGPVATIGEVVDSRAIGAYRRARIAAPTIVDSALPGQFVSIGTDTPGALLRRPFAVANVDRAEGVLDLVIAYVGVGSAWLASRPVGAAIDIVGPLGTGFRPPAGPARCLLVGGGYGVAALAWLADDLLAAGHDVELLSGARTADALLPTTGASGEPVASATGGEVRLIEVTQDGSRGRQGLVTDALRDRLAVVAAPDVSAAGVGSPRDARFGRPPDARFGRQLDARLDAQRDVNRGAAVVVYTCGPMPMLAAVAEICGAADVACQVAVEEHMGCSVGVCMTCVVPTRDGYVRACIDGPVLDADRVAWTSVLAGRSGP